ncbi:nucleotide sugar dehydrogenase [Streptomyces sp. NPDC006660]|uniref:nucleotide sugar dehydrogenase n=1 Tax=Streptomyces sp. NPDC006660 TaxID=3156901 RepID=UPI0033C5E77A
MRVVVVGQGYVGLPLALSAAEAGHQVIGYDTDAWKVKQLANGVSYINSVPGADIARLLGCGTYRPTSDENELKGFDVAVISVPTPLRDGAPDLSHVESAASMLARVLSPGATIVLESTTYPGTTTGVVGPLIESRSGLVAGRDFHLGFSPERMAPQLPEWGLHNTPKLVSGIDDASLEAVDAFYRTVVGRTVRVSGCAEAELAKLLENTFRYVNIAFVNELAVHSHALGVDVWEAVEAAGSKPFGFMKFTPGPGVAGHCLPIDPHYLAWWVERGVGRRFRIVDSAYDVNHDMPQYVARRVAEGLNSRERSVRGARVLLLGLARRNTDDVRESLTSRVISELSRLGAEMYVADPYVPAQAPSTREALAGAHQVEATPAELADADVVVVLEDHDSFDFDEIVQHSRYVFDCRRRTHGAQVEVL